MILDSDGNALASYDDELTARAILHAMIKIEPDAADELYLLTYGDDGMPVGDARKVFDVPPAVTIDGTISCLQEVTATAFIRESSSKQTLRFRPMTPWKPTVAGDLQPQGV